MTEAEERIIAALDRIHAEMQGSRKDVKELTKSINTLIDLVEVG